MSSIRKTSAGRQTPEKSTRPSASRGVGPGGAAGKGLRLANELAFPAFDGSSLVAGVWAVPTVCAPNQIPPVVANAATQLKARCFILVQDYTGDPVRMQPSAYLDIFTAWPSGLPKVLVHQLLEVAKRPNGALVVEGKQLHHLDATDVLHRIDPELSVEDAGPAHAAWAAEF